MARLADRVVLLDAGRVRAQGSVFDLLAGLGAEKPLGAVLQATVGDIQDGLSTLLFDGGVLLATEVGQPGKQVRVRIGAEVEMHCGSARLVARITAASVQRLQLKAGICAFAVIKSVIVEGG